MRKDGTRVRRAHVRLAADRRASGQQTGWMTSMTNITEAKRIRDQLSASHERFTTVLEGLDAAVSVLSVQQGELLFANRSYRLWFGADARGHAAAGRRRPALPHRRASDDGDDAVDGLRRPADAGAHRRPAPTRARSSSRRCSKWFDVRSRYLQWTDGRLAQMLIATDITRAPPRRGAGGARRPRGAGRRAGWSRWARWRRRWRTS